MDKGLDSEVPIHRRGLVARVQVQERTVLGCPVGVSRVVWNDRGYGRCILCNQAGQIDIGRVLEGSGHFHALLPSPAPLYQRTQHGFRRNIRLDSTIASKLLFSSYRCLPTATDRISILFWRRIYVLWVSFHGPDYYVFPLTLPAAAGAVSQVLNRWIGLKLKPNRPPANFIPPIYGGKTGSPSSRPI